MMLYALLRKKLCSDVHDALHRLLLHYDQ